MARAGAFGLALLLLVGLVAVATAPMAQRPPKQEPKLPAPLDGSVPVSTP